MTTAQRPEPGARTSDYWLALPEGWERLTLDPAQWDHRIAAIVGRAFRGMVHQPGLRMEAEGQLRTQAAAAHANGGVDLYLAVRAPGGIPLAAALVVTVLPPAADGTPLDLERLGLALGAQGADVSMVDLPSAGTALRHRHREAPPDEATYGSRMSVTHLDLRVAVPGTATHLLLSFSTPMEPLADALVELFDSIASTLRWMS